MGGKADALFSVYGTPVIVDQFSELVTITRGLASTPTVPAIRLERMYETIDSNGVMTPLRLVDWEIVATDYELSGNVAAPETGDRITDAISVVYEVTPLPGLQCYEATGSGEVWRVHTKRVK